MEIANKTIDEFDDSYITMEDKKKLLKVIKLAYQKSHSWSDDILLRCLVEDYYKQVVRGMNKEDYLKEKEIERRGDLETLLDGV